MKFSDCFSMDAHKYNPVPASWMGKVYRLWSTQRYSMSVYLRLTEYCHWRYRRSGNRFFLFLARYWKRKNEVVNQFEHGFQHDIAAGTLFHHTGVTLQDGVRIEPNVQIFKQVTLALVKGQTCVLEQDSVVFSHVIILGRRIGRGSVVGAGSVVLADVAPNVVVAGNPARVIKVCESSREYLEFV